jgi:hypothetical protein
MRVFVRVLVFVVIVVIGELRVGPRLEASTVRGWLFEAGNDGFLEEHIHK